MPLGAYYVPTMAAIIVVFAYGRGYLARALAWKPFQILGEVSFGFYLFHQMAITYLENYKGVLGLPACHLCCV